MDFYGVSDGYVLGIIDLDSLYVELAFHDDRTAEGVERTVRDRILFRHGVPDQLHSDHAAEFVGRVMKSLASKYGYMPTTTGGYCPTGNSTIESFWAYLGICIRNLSDDEDTTTSETTSNEWLSHGTARSANRCLFRLSKS